MSAKLAAISSHQLLCRQPGFVHTTDEFRTVTLDAVTVTHAERGPQVGKVEIFRVDGGLGAAERVAEIKDVMQQAGGVQIETLTTRPLPGTQSQPQLGRRSGPWGHRR